MNIDEPTENLIKAVDVAIWCYSVKKNKKRGSKIKVDFNGAMEDLIDAYNKLELSKYEVVFSEPTPQEEK